MATVDLISNSVELYGMDRLTVSSACVKGGASKNEANHSNSFRNSNVPIKSADLHQWDKTNSPSSLIESSRRPRPSNRNRTRNQIRWTRQNKRNSLVKAQRLNSRRKEILKPVRTKMAVLHHHKQPHLGIFRSRDDTCPAGRLA